MKPKEKAKELIEKFECYVDYQGDDCFNEREKMLINAKQCALIAVDEIIEHINKSYMNKEIVKGSVLYWEEIKEEISSYEMVS